MGLLILPGEVTRKAKFRCEVCKKPFFDGEERTYQRHVQRCYDEHEERFTREAKGPVLFPDIGDPEFERWVADNARAILEGRLKM